MSEERIVAILGASSDRSKFGNKSVRAHLRAGWKVIPVNLKSGTIEGLDIATALDQIAGTTERISVYLPPRVLLGMLPEIAAIGCDELWLNPGCYDDEVLRQAERLNLNVVTGCSIIDVGFSPGDFPD